MAQRLIGGSIRDPKACGEPRGRDSDAEPRRAGIVGGLAVSCSKDELLANVSLYWLTGTVRSSFQPYVDVASAGAMTWVVETLKKWVGSTKVPAGFASFPRDLNPPPREWAERFFNVVRWTEMPRGGHFAALEEPDLLADELRIFFRPLRNASTER
jgi:pimeloyl-ACP methyl ester carboxylesterase